MIRVQFPLQVMHVNQQVNESLFVEQGLNASAKYIYSCQPAQSAQTDLSRNYLLVLSFMYIKGLYYHMWLLKLHVE